jgi:hypothetical protein
MALTVLSQQPNFYLNSWIHAAKATLDISRENISTSAGIHKVAVT